MAEMVSGGPSQNSAQKGQANAAQAKNVQVKTQQANDPQQSLSSFFGKLRLSTLFSASPDASSKQVLSQHPAGCTCPDCAGKAKDDAVSDLMSAFSKFKKDSTVVSPESVQDKQQKQSAPETVLAPHPAGCTCPDCAGKAKDDAVSDLMSAFSKFKKDSQPDSSSASQEAQKQVFESTSYQQAAQIAIIPAFDSKSGDFSLEKKRGNDEEAAKRKEHGTPANKNGEMASAPSKPEHGSSKKPGNASQAAKPVYVIGTYTYDDILASAWLRKLYGHLVGLHAPEEGEKKGQAGESKAPKPKNQGKDSHKEKESREPGRQANEKKVEAGSPKDELKGQKTSPGDLEKEKKSKHASQQKQDEKRESEKDRQKDEARKPSSAPDSRQGKAGGKEKEAGQDNKKPHSEEKPASLPVEKPKQSEKYGQGHGKAKNALKKKKARARKAISYRAKKRRKARQSVASRHKKRRSGLKLHGKKWPFSRRHAAKKRLRFPLPSRKRRARRASAVSRPSKKLISNKNASGGIGDGKWQIFACN